MKALWITSHKDTLNSIRPEAEALIGLALAGVDMEVMTQGDSVYREDMEAAGVRVIDYVPERKFDAGSARIIRRCLDEGRHDVVHLFNNKAIANGLLAARKWPGKVITYRGQTGNISRWNPACYLTHLNSRVDAIVCVADAVRHSVAAELKNPGKAVTIPEIASGNSGASQTIKVMGGEDWLRWIERMRSSLLVEWCTISSCIGCPISSWARSRAGSRCGCSAAVSRPRWRPGSTRSTSATGTSRRASASSTPSTSRAPSMSGPP